jgi:hypothetical protein
MILSNISDPFKTQYYHQQYLVDGSTYYKSKLDAMGATGHQKDRIQFDWNHEFWSKCDWREPKETIEQLYEGLAHTIRNNFDKVYIHWSAGWDTNTIASVFKTAGLKIDGLIIEDQPWKPPEEIPNTIEAAKELKASTWPDLEIIVYYGSADVISKMYNQYGNDYVYRPSYVNWLCWIPRSVALSSVNNDGDTLRKISDNPRHIILDGIEKPKLDIMADGNWYSRFADFRVVQYIDSPTFPFFINTVEPRIHIKQSYMLARYLKSKGVSDHTTYHNWMTKAGKDDNLYIEYNKAISRVNPNKWVTTTAFLKRDLGSDAFYKRAEVLLKRELGHMEADRIIKLYHEGRTKVNNASFAASTVIGAPYKLVDVT